MPELFAGPQAEFEEGAHKILRHAETEIGVFRLGGEFFAYQNRCPHQGGPVCQGKPFRKVEEVLAQDRSSLGLEFSQERTHIVCPWHGYEYDIRTGLHPGDPTFRLRAYEVLLRDGEVYVRV